MKFTIDIGGTRAILEGKQLGQLVNILQRAHRIEQKWVGDGKGHGGGNYLNLLRQFEPSSNMSVRVMADDEFGALELVTKMEDEKK